ncbi:MAG: GIY-YIG nuclease family protein [Clostridiaceae bacterium]|nr:GIY-YIG nuclease family protein [Eubacteriales bacterium]
MMNEKSKELKRQYKLTRPDMGIFMIRSAAGDRAYLQATQDLKGSMNGALARLNSGMHPWRELQEAWKKLGADSFAVEVLERLPYDEKDEMKTDYSEELTLLEMLWTDRLEAEGVRLYKKRLT